MPNTPVAKLSLFLSGEQERVIPDQDPRPDDDSARRARVPTAS